MNQHHRDTDKAQKKKALTSAPSIKDAARCMTLVERMMASQSVEEVWAIHTASMASYGFTRVIYGLTHFVTLQNIGQRDDYFVLSNHNDAYLDAFFSNDLFNASPMLSWAIENSGVARWTWLRSDPDTLTERQRKLLTLNQLHGINDGFTISFQDPSPRLKAAIGLAACSDLSYCDVQKIWENHSRNILLLNNVAHLKISSLPVPKDTQKLSPRQREVLEWVGDGKTLQDVATIMGLNIATVEKHIRKAKETLAVETTAQAVLKASLQKEIFQDHRV